MSKTVRVFLMGHHFAIGWLDGGLIKVWRVNDRLQIKVKDYMEQHHLLVTFQTAASFPWLADYWEGGGVS